MLFVGYLPIGSSLLTVSAVGNVLAMKWLCDLALGRRLTQHSFFVVCFAYYNH